MTAIVHFSQLKKHLLIPSLREQRTDFREMHADGAALLLERRELGQTHQPFQEQKVEHLKS